MKKSTINRIHRKREHRNEILSRLVFSKFYGLKDMTLPKAIEIIKPYKGEIAAELHYLDWYDRLDGREPDNRKGVDTYGYKSEQTILYDLQYISDRFTAQFRLQWVLDLLDKN